MANAPGRDAIIEIVRVNLQAVDPQISGVSEETRLAGDQSIIDSVGMVNFLIAVEQAFDQRIDISSLFLEHAGQSDEESPFRTVGSFADLILTHWDSKVSES